MSSLGFLSSINLGTLATILVIVAAVFPFFLRCRSNRDPLEGNVARDLDADRPPLR